MKKILFILLALTVFNCNSDDVTPTEDTAEATLLGRWNLVGFEGSVLYEFTTNKRYTMYSPDGVFESLEDVIASDRPGNDYWYEGELVTIDLNFGNTITLTPQFKCNNEVIDWVDDTGTIHSSMFRENFDYTTCN